MPKYLLLHFYFTSQIWCGFIIDFVTLCCLRNFGGRVSKRLLVFDIVDSIWSAWLEGIEEFSTIG